MLATGGAGAATRKEVGFMAIDVKSRAVLSLMQHDGATDRDRDAARLLSQCDLGLLTVEATGHRGGAREGHPAADVLIHADHDLVSEARQTGAAVKIERAIRQALGPTPVRHLQWVESSPLTGPSTGAGAGEPTGKDMHVPRSPNNQPPMPRFEHQGRHGPTYAGTHPAPPKGPPRVPGRGM
jgi:hypothetical protein